MRERVGDGFDEDLASRTEAFTGIGSSGRVGSWGLVPWYRPARRAVVWRKGVGSRRRARWYRPRCVQLRTGAGPAWCYRRGLRTDPDRVGLPQEFRPVRRRRSRIRATDDRAALAA